jgi:hypothetical protein
MTLKPPRNIAIFGAGGKMGCRIIDHLKKDPNFRLRCVEVSPQGKARVAERGVACEAENVALAQSDVIILALPDRILGKAAQGIVPAAKTGALIILLDPAVAHAGELPLRSDVAYFVTHPCHPSVFAHEDDPEARADFFGGTKAGHPIVCALLQGSEGNYQDGEALARLFFAPVLRAHRITVEQMAILEPAMAETVVAALIAVIREAMDEAVQRGVPAEAARDFIYGHIKVPLGIAFEQVDFTFSDGAKLIMQYGRERMLRPDWKKLFEPESVQEQVRAIVTGKLPPFTQPG